MNGFWVREDAILAAHDRQLAEHGGQKARAPDLAVCGEPDAPALAAAYAAGIARNHRFIEGNKRTAWIAARLFLRINRIACHLITAKPNALCLHSPLEI